eukprot:353596-Chlamydomonas_euryale.AAC.10
MRRTQLARELPGETGWLRRGARLRARASAEPRGCEGVARQPEAARCTAHALRWRPGSNTEAARGGPPPPLPRFRQAKFGID